MRLEENAGKSKDLTNLCIAECKITLFLFYRILLVLSHDFNQAKRNRAWRQNVRQGDAYNQQGDDHNRASRSKALVDKHWFGTNVKKG